MTINEDEYSSNAHIDEAFENELDFDSLIDSTSWQPPGKYYQVMPKSIRSAVETTVGSNERLRQELREEYLPALLKGGTLKCWSKANPRYIELLQQKQLYAGHVAAADGTLAKYETLGLVGAQIAITRVTYQGNTGQLATNIMYWGKEIPRKTTAADIAEAIRSRGKELTDKLPNLFLYALMLYKERQMLLDAPANTFKILHGPIFPHEMLSGSGKHYTMKRCLELIQNIIDDGMYVSIVSKERQYPELLTLGMALDAGEYIIVNSGIEILDDFYGDGERAHYTDTRIPEYGNKSQKELFSDFQKGYGPKVVQGVFRAHPMSPPYVFYCNAENLDIAVHMLLADAANTGARGFPLLVDLADQYSSGTFKAGEYTEHMNAEFVRASHGSGMYQSERSTRD
ncbi:MAG: hypothetical protein HS100_04390 [Anaerolineales bacterium]|nr:hypothetical protein [Anaerolineales bacterium]